MTSVQGKAPSRLRLPIIRKSNGRRLRLSVLAALAAVVSTLATISTPGVARAAGTPIPCPTDPDIVWTARVIRPLIVYTGYRYTVVSANPTFFVSDGRVVDNALDSEITATFTSQQSRTFRVQVTVGTSAQLTPKLQSTVSVSIVQEHTTAIGVNATVSVPPRGRVTGLYGVHGFDVVYDVQTITRTNVSADCLDQGTQRATTSAPTRIEGWRFEAG
jgi:hypothetical protein